MTKQVTDTDANCLSLFKQKGPDYPRWNKPFTIFVVHNKKGPPRPGCSMKLREAGLAKNFLFSFEALQTINCYIFYTVSPLAKG